MSKEEAKFAKTQKLKKAGTTKVKKDDKPNKKDKGSEKKVMFQKPVDYEKIISENQQIIAMEEALKEVKKQMLDTFSVNDRKIQGKDE